MRILQVNTGDVGGGAERVSLDLHSSYHRAGHESWLAVGSQRAENPGVIPIDHDRFRNPISRGIGSMGRTATESRNRLIHETGRAFRAVAQPKAAADRWLGREGGSFPGTWHLLDFLPATPDILHLHNLHGDYFDLAALPTLSGPQPTFLTLHDAWLSTGHCAHSFSCDRWEIGCGRCPDLTIYPAARRDATNRNWLRKADIASRSKLRIATPSAWLMDRIERSLLMRGVVETRVIPNGVDRSIFRPGDQATARSALGIPQHAAVLTFAAYGTRTNAWKDFGTLEAMVQRLGRGEGNPIVMFALGEAAQPEVIGRAELRYVPFLDDRKAVARYLQATDIYVHAARVDTFPNTVIEALSCGVPVVATRVGGIPEQIVSGVTGLLVEPGMHQSMAQAVDALLTDDVKRRDFAAAAADDAARRFDLGIARDAYLEWYADALSETAGSPST
jgi:glycosyltransferase involved in cell wall biosynthesis